MELDKIFNEKYGDENIIKKSEKLPNKINIYLEKGKIIDKEWNSNEINKIINDCIKIENIFADINKIKESIKEFKLYDKILINFNPEENEINDFLNNIKKFGSIVDDYIKYIPSNIIQDNENRKMISDWINPNIILKFKLLYKVSRDGDRISTFTEKVKGKYPTLVIIQSKSGFKFGGYTSVEWNMTGSYKYITDKSAFIFSIDKKKKI